MRFHVVALPHTVTSNEFNACAYTGKVLRFCRMMRSLGHQVFHYGAEGSQADCDEHINTITAAEQARYFGSTNWRRDGFDIKWEAGVPYWEISNLRAAAEIKAREQRGDFICLVGGVCHKPIADAVGATNSITVEPFIGYYGVFAKYKVFESYTHQAAVYMKYSSDPDGSLYDAVIPNYYDPEELPFCADKGDYLLFLARVIKRKGIEIAIETARAAGMKLVIAGQGVKHIDADKIVYDAGEMSLQGVDVEYVGYADVAKRADLMGHARALIQATIFMEPFGGTVVESALTGTPAITTDYAAFSETVLHGVTGYRCHTREEFVWAAQHCHELDPVRISQRALTLYSMDRVKYMYERYFQMLSKLWQDGWNTVGDGSDTNLLRDNQ